MTVRRWRVAGFLAAVLVTASAGPSAQQPLVTPGGILPVLDTYLESLRQQVGIPGMSVAVLKDGALVWEKGYGFANLATRERATPDTPYLVGDVSQTLAAVLLLQCVEQRRLELDERFERYGLSTPEPDATLRSVLAHASPEGVREPFTYNPPRYAQLTSVMEWCARGQPYRKSVAHRILNGLAMRDSVPGTDLEDPDLELPEGLFDESDLDRYRRVLSRLAVPYKVTGRNRTERTELPAAGMNAADGLVTTVRDLARFDAAIDSIDSTPLLLQPETLAVAWTPAPGRNGLPSPMGLGWFVQFYRGERVVWTFGHVANAYSALVLKLPAKNTTFILLANSDGLSAPFQLPAGDVTRSVFATLFLKLTT
jgi:CubicO group peptidase (beta-lactamase class C family)